MNETPGYMSYLLRLWQAQENGAWIWRASLESSQSGQRWNFANLADCFAFLEEQAAKLPMKEVKNKKLHTQEID